VKVKTILAIIVVVGGVTLYQASNSQLPTVNLGGHLQ
jgi:hypothetical protein